MFPSPVVLAMTVVAFLAACQPLPQPFQPGQARKSANPLLDLPDHPGVVVKPVAGMEDEAASRLASEMTAELIRRNLPAFTGEGNRASFTLTGEISPLPRGRNRMEVRLIWRLTDSDGTQTGEHVLDLATRRSAWNKASPTLLRELAVKSAGPVAALIREPAPVDQTLSRAKRSMHVWPIEGAPEAAGALLRAEIETALRRNGIRVTSKLVGDSVILVGAVSLKPGSEGFRDLSLEWTMMRPDGGELGNLRQRNPVRARDLEENWPQIAKNIAGGTAQGVKDLLDKLPATALGAAAGAEK